MEVLCIMNEENQIEFIRRLILSTKKPSYQTTNKKEAVANCFGIYFVSILTGKGTAVSFL